jgi:hypothetical protein
VFLFFLAKPTLSIPLPLPLSSVSLYSDLFTPDPQPTHVPSSLIPHQNKPTPPSVHRYLALDTPSSLPSSLSLSFSFFLPSFLPIYPSPLVILYHSSTFETHAVFQQRSLPVAICRAERLEKKKRRNDHGRSRIEDRNSTLLS